MDAHEAHTAEAQQRAAAEEELAKSALRQAEIKRRIAEAEQKLKDRELARKGKRGRMKVNEQTIENNLHALLVRLRRGYLPGEVMSTPSAPPAQVLASAQQNLQHHAAGRAAPCVRRTSITSSSTVRSRTASGLKAAIRRRASCRSPRHCRYSTPSSSRDGGVE
jgi:hypothetical protein